MTTVSHNPTDKHFDAARVLGDNADLPMRRDGYADLMETMFASYDHILPLAVIVEVVSRCRSDLAGSPPGALPELLDRLARHRLSALSDQR